MAGAGRAFGAAGAVVSAGPGQPNIVIPYADMQAVTMDKSLLTGAGIVIVASDGSKIKFSATDMSLGGLKKVYAKVAAAIRQANDQVAVDTI